MTDDLLPAELVDAPPFADELDEALLAGRELPPDVVPWKIETLNDAEWAARKLAALEDRASEVRRTHTAWMARIEENEEAELRRVQPGIEFFRGRLKEFALRRRRIEGGKVRDATTHVPSAEVSTRQAAPKAVLEDEAAFIVWAYDAITSDEYAEVVKTTEKVLIDALRKATSIVERDGEQVVVWSSTGIRVEGCAVEQAEPTATVKIIKAEQQELGE